MQITQIGSAEGLRTLIRVNAPDAFLYAIAKVQPTEPPALKAAIVRAFKEIAISLAETVGPPQWGIETKNFDPRNDAKITLDYIFQVSNYILLSGGCAYASVAAWARHLPTSSRRLKSSEHNLCRPTSSLCCTNTRTPHCGGGMASAVRKNERNQREAWLGEAWSGKLTEQTRGMGYTVPYLRLV